MKFLGICSILLAGLLSFSSSQYSPNMTGYEDKIEQQKEVADQKIQIALLLDTSNSMDGLIGQAKSRLWNIVNTLTTLKYNGKEPQLEIALYEYGNDGLSSENNFIRMVTPFTNDLDLISEKLFSLRTNGGNEYCGAVIDKATSQLQWKDGKDNMKLIYIAGNEPFTQGPINFREAISKSLNKDIYINAILCGGQSSEDATSWKEGAIKGNGKFFIIDSDKVIQFISTPYDNDINTLNDKLNDTYIGYGSHGESKKMNQAIQDANAESMSVANKAERATSKTKTVYNNSSWDLIDNYKQDKDAITKIKKEDLPAAYKNLSEVEIKRELEAKIQERDIVTKQISELSIKRQSYIDSENKKSNNSDDLGSALEISILELANKLGYKK